MIILFLCVANPHLDATGKLQRSLCELLCWWLLELRFADDLEHRFKRPHPETWQGRLAKDRRCGALRGLARRVRREPTLTPTRLPARSPGSVT